MRTICFAPDLLDQLQSVLTATLLAATVVKKQLGDVIEAAVIAVIVVFAALLGIVRECRT